MVQVSDSHAVFPRWDEVAVQSVLREQSEAGRTSVRVRALSVLTVVVRFSSVSVWITVVGALRALINVWKTNTWTSHIDRTSTRKATQRKNVCGLVDEISMCNNELFVIIEVVIVGVAVVYRQLFSLEEETWNFVWSIIMVPIDAHRSYKHIDTALRPISRPTLIACCIQSM